MQNVLNSVKTSAYQVAEYLTPILKNSKFKESGVLTPEEFVVAGDFLIHHCPTWHWCSCDTENLRPYLPKDKQFLRTKNVPCYKRCIQLENSDITENPLESCDFRDWISADKNDSLNINDDPLDLDENKNTNDLNETKEEDQIPLDMDAYLSLKVNELKNETVDKKVIELLPVRRYDLSITYDKYYQTPRFWIMGYDEDATPLLPEQMYQDISTEHVHKTITIEPHPHLPLNILLSVHPCRHSEMMKRIVDVMAQGGQEVNIQMYLLIFLKFIQCVIPTIEYDYTKNVQVNFT